MRGIHGYGPAGQCITESLFPAVGSVLASDLEATLEGSTARFVVADRGQYPGARVEQFRE
jgi:hypothetical protein